MVLIDCFYYIISVNIVDFTQYDILHTGKYLNGEKVYVMLYKGAEFDETSYKKIFYYHDEEYEDIQEDSKIKKVLNYILEYI